MIVPLCEGLSRRLAALAHRLDDTAEELHAHAQWRALHADHRDVTVEQKLQVASAIVAAAAAALRVLRARP